MGIYYKDRLKDVVVWRNPRQGDLRIGKLPRLTINYQLPALFFVVLGVLAILKYISLHSSFFDLGIFLTLFYKISHYGEWWHLFVGHAQPLMLIYAAIYKVLPESFAPLVVIVLQAFFLALPGFWILKRYGQFLFLLFALYFPLWFNALFDFHMDHLAVPLLFWFYFLVEDGRYKCTVLPAILLVFVKEPFALQTAACGVYLTVRGLHSVLHGQKIAGCHLLSAINWQSVTNYQQIIIGFFLISFGFGYFYLLINYIFPSLTGKMGYLSTSAFSWMGNSFGEIIRFIFIHPFTILKEILGTPRKIFYLVAVFGPFLFIPFLAPLYLIPAVPILLISLLSHDPNHYTYAHHYTAGLIAPVFMAFIKGLPKIEKLIGGLWLVICISLLFHILLSPSPISRIFWTNKVWNYGYQAYIPTERDRVIKETLKRFIPSDPKVAVSTQNALNWARLAHRRYYLAFPIGVTEPVPSHLWRNKTRNSTPVYAQYVVLDLKRPWYIVDQGCSWQTSEPLNLTRRELKVLGFSQDLGTIKWASCARETPIIWKSPSGRVYQGILEKVFIDLLSEVLKSYEILYENDGFLILKRIDL